MTRHRGDGARLVRTTTQLLTTGAAIVGLAACGSSSAGPTTTLAPLRTTTSSIRPVATTARPATTLKPVVLTTVATTTTLAATTTAATTTTSSTTTSSTSSTSTTTTIPAGAKLVMSDAGLGDAVFGADPDQVIAYVTGILGKPTTDSGWADPSSAFVGCPGTAVRGVTWGDLKLMFSDSSWVTSDRRHFFSYTWGPPLSTTPNPAGLATTKKITFGSTVQDVRAAYPQAIVNPGDDILAANFIVNDHFAGFLTGVKADDTVTAVLGGVGCGE